MSKMGQWILQQQEDDDASSSAGHRDRPSTRDDLVCSRVRHTNWRLSRELYPSRAYHLSASWQLRQTDRTQPDRLRCSGVIKGVGYRDRAVTGVRHTGSWPVALPVS